MNHPNATLANFLTYMWCLWKSRNDALFNGKYRYPTQIHFMANALQHSLEMHDILRGKNTNKQVQGTDLSSPKQRQRQVEMQDQKTSKGNTIKSVLHITGSKFFSDASWRTRNAPGSSSDTTGVGVYCQVLEEGKNAEIVIEASILTASSVLQAELEALLVAARIGSALKLHNHTFLTDNSVLAAAAALETTSLQQIPWEIRKHIAEYKALTEPSQVAIYHINRDLNEVAHECAHQALRHSMSQPIFSCSSSAHRNTDCPFLYAVSQIKSPGLVLHVVNCL
jgi:ribonuclease HI